MGAGCQTSRVSTPPSAAQTVATPRIDRVELRRQAETILRALVGSDDAVLRKDQWSAIEALVVDRRRARRIVSA